MEQTWGSQAPVGYRSFQIGFVFVEYDLLNTTTSIHSCIYMNFRINLTQFYINFLRQKRQIDVLYVSFNAWDSQVLFYTPFQFSFTVPLNSQRCLLRVDLKEFLISVFDFSIENNVRILFYKTKVKLLRICPPI